MADVLIAGGGIAGSALAILLGRRGLKVELFERCRFPREKPCGEGLMPAGVGVIERLGLSAAVGGVRFDGVRYHFGRRIAQGRFPRGTGFPSSGIGQRRRHLDRVLFEAAAGTAGVTACAEATVQEPIWEKGRVVGLIVNGHGRRGRLVVAADGARSRIRHRLGLDEPARRRRIGLRRHFRLAPGSPESPWVDVFVRPDHELYVTPLPDGELLVAGLGSARALGGSARRRFELWWRAEPDLASRLEGAREASDLMSAFPLSGRARAGVGPGVALLGDAAGFADPITGGGMTQALLSAELLAEKTAAGLDRSDDAWLREFDRSRARMLRDYRMLTASLLWLSGHPRLAGRVLGGLRACPSLFSHLLGVSAGMRRLFAGSARAGVTRGLRSDSKAS